MLFIYLLVYDVVKSWLVNVFFEKKNIQAFAG